jgi:tetratricopeptide (TPR) repeat protein
MTSRGRRSLRAAALLVAALLLALFAGGEAVAKKKKEEKERRQYTVGESMHKKLTAAQEALEAEDHATAREILEPMAKKSRLNPYERALVYLFLAYSEASEEHYDQALEYFEKCLAEDALPPGQQLSTRFNVAQLYLATEQYADAVRSLELWFQDVENPNSSAFYMLAVARYQLEDVEGAIEPAREAVVRASEPKENWLQLLIGLLFETKRYEEAVKPLELLVALHPKRTYWTQLSALYAHLGQEPQSLAVMQIAYQEGFLEKDREIRQLAQLFLANGLPYRAALAIEQALADEVVESEASAWELLANSWLLAREYERSLEPLARAAELAEDGDLYVRLGQVHLERENWSEAAAALAKAFAKGGLDASGNANLLMGIALYHQDDPRRARRHFSAALGDDASREPARNWLDLLERETRSG